MTTFTNDATDEMRARLAPLVLKGSPGKVHATTLHALCLSILRSQGRRFSLLTDEAHRKGLAEAARAHELESGVVDFLTRTSFLKNTGVSVAAYRPDGSYENRLFATPGRAMSRQRRNEDCWNLTTFWSRS